ncbi:MAG: endonuclease III [Clostridiales bacterium]|nr:endonuclease III [Clostridiales bacterium]
MGRISAKDKKILADEVWERLNKEFPDSSCSLEKDSPERLAVRGILSAQCTDVTVNKVCRVLFDRYPSMEDILKADIDDIGKIIRPCGLTKSKTASVMDFAGLYEGEWGHKVPDSREELMRCRGVGRKIANLILGEVYGIPAVVVDTHCKRVMYRIGITSSEDPKKAEDDICKFFEDHKWIRTGHLSVDLGRKYCRSQKPLCDECPLKDVCRRVGL